MSSKITEREYEIFKAWRELNLLQYWSLEEIYKHHQEFGGEDYPHINYEGIAQKLNIDLIDAKNAVISVLEKWGDGEMLPLARHNQHRYYSMKANIKFLKGTLSHMESTPPMFGIDEKQKALNKMRNKIKEMEEKLKILKKSLNKYMRENEPHLVGEEYFEDENP